MQDPKSKRNDHIHPVVSKPHQCKSSLFSLRYWNDKSPFWCAIALAPQNKPHSIVKTPQSSNERFDISNKAYSIFYTQNFGFIPLVTEEKIDKSNKQYTFRYIEFFPFDIRSNSIKLLIDIFWSTRNVCWGKLKLCVGRLTLRGGKVCTQQVLVKRRKISSMRNERQKSKFIDGQDWITQETF